MTGRIGAILPVLATGGASYWTDPAIWAVIDFVVLAVLLVKFGGPAISRIFASKTEAIRTAVATAEHALAEAQRTLDEQKRLEADQAKILADVGASAKALAQTLVADLELQGQTEISRAREAARAEIERERQAMLSSVRADVLQSAFAEAERLIRESLDDKRQRGLFEAFAARAEEVRL